MTTDEVRAYYDSFGEREWLRLTRSTDGMLEFILTCHTITTHLSTPARVLDIGGGPGRYSIWLAEQGYQVVLADLSPQLIDIARSKVATSSAASSIEEIVVAHACDLSRWADGSFDAVLSLGPFYHLPDPTDRDRAARELARVLRPQGLAFVALIPRYAFLRRSLALAPERSHLAQPHFVEQVLERGIFSNDRPGRFTSGYGVRPQDVAPFFAGYGLTMRTLLASEGIVPDLQGALAELGTQDPPTYQAALNIIIRTASDPSILGLANHLLYVGQKS